MSRSASSGWTSPPSPIQTGRFRIARIPPGPREIEFSHVGYGRTTQMINVQAGSSQILTIRLAVSAIELDSLVVTVDARTNFLERRGFYERANRAGDGGTYIHFDVIQNRFNDPTSLLVEIPYLFIRPRKSSGNAILTLTA